MRTLSPSYVGTFAAVVSLSLLSACAGDPTMPFHSATPLAAKGGPTGSTTVYIYSMNGDLTFANAPAVSMPTGKAFTNLSIPNVQLVVGAAPHATNDCGAPVSSFTDTWLANGGSYSDTWLGTYNVNKFMTANFMGSNGVATMQMSAQNKVVVSGPDASGVMTASYINVASYNDSRSTYFDNKHRCLSFVLTATPQ